jgi:hypothetical protein
MTRKRPTARDIERVLEETVNAYEEALAIVRTGFRAPAQRYPRPPEPLHPGTA